MNRRDFLQRGGALAVGTAAGVLSPATALAAPRSGPKRKRVLRAAHLTDIHV